MTSPERKDMSIPADESGYSEKKSGLLIDRGIGKGLSSTNSNNILFSKKTIKKKKGK